MTISVKWATTLAINGATMGGLPRIAGTAGDLKSALNALLCTGYNIITLDGLSRTGTTATATKSGGLGFILDQVVSVYDANQPEWNEQYRVATVGPNTVTFAVPETHAAAPTGTIKMKASPAGFAMTDLGAQLAVFRSDDITGTRLNFWVDDSAQTYARVLGYETWANGVGTGPFPTDTQQSGGLYGMKRNAAGTTASNYIFVSDERFFYLFVEYYPSIYPGMYSYIIFGDIISWMNVDGFGCIITASTTGTPTPGGGGFWSYTSTVGKFLARDSTLNPETCVNFLNFGPGESLSAFGYAGYTYPNPLDGGNLMYDPIRIAQSANIPRGEYPGLSVPLHASPHSSGQILDSFPDKPGRKFIAVKNINTEVLIDIIGPWRE